MHSVLFVCLGNICRSPTAEGIFSNLIGKKGIKTVSVDSVGTGGWHVGNAPDRRAQWTAKQRGIDLSRLKSRQIEAKDFFRFDTIIAMDTQNLSDLRRLAGPEHQDKLFLLMDFAPELNLKDVPDPYYGGEDGFDDVFDMIELACTGVLLHAEARIGQD